MSKDHFLSFPLWQNSLIRISNAPVLYEDRFSKGITQVKDLMDDSYDFLSLASFQNRYLLKVRPLPFFGIIHAVQFLQQQIPRSQLKYENLMNSFLKNQKSSRMVYKELTLIQRGPNITIIGDNWTNQKRLFDIVGKLLHRDPEPLYPSCPSNADLANDFINFFGTKTSKIRNDIESHSLQQSMQFIDTSLSGARLRKFKCVDY